MGVARRFVGATAGKDDRPKAPTSGSDIKANDSRSVTGGKKDGVRLERKTDGRMAHRNILPDIFLLLLLMLLLLFFLREVKVLVGKAYIHCAPKYFGMNRLFLESIKQHNWAFFRRKK